MGLRNRKRRFKLVQYKYSNTRQNKSLLKKNNPGRDGRQIWFKYFSNIQIQDANVELQAARNITWIDLEELPRGLQEEPLDDE